MPLPDQIERGLTDFVESAKSALAGDLVSVILFGSAAEGTHRPSSDVNLVLVLRRFDAERAAALREPLRFAASAIRLKAMFLLEEEIPRAATAFAEKFADISRRRRTLHGSDPFAGLAIPREVLVARLDQSLLNQAIRLRETWVARSLREEQAARAVADAAGPLRAAAATILELEGSPAPSPREALFRLVRELDPGAEAEAALAQVSAAREHRAIPPGAAAATLLRLGFWAERLRSRAAALARK